jgi:type I restriction enzyme S subunit
MSLNQPELPASWKTSSLRMSCDIVTSSMSYKDFLRAEESTDGDAVPCMAVKVSDMNLPGNQTMFVTANAVKRLPAALAARKLVPPNSVVFPKRGAAIATNKKRLTTKWTALDPNLIALLPKDSVDAKFLFFWSQTFDLRSITDPGPTPQLNKKDLLPVQMLLPTSLSEQRWIAALLSALQRAIERQERLIALTVELKKALMHKLFIEGTGYEPPKQTEIGPVPGTWTESRLGNIARFSSGGTPSREVPEYWDGGTIPWVKTTEINYGNISDTDERITQAGLDNSSAKIFLPGTLLMAMYGQGVTRGRLGILGIAAATNQACAAIMPFSEEEISTNFLYYFLEFHYEHLRQRGHGANQTNLSMTLLKEFPVYYPKQPEQLTIIGVLRALDEKRAIHVRGRTELTALFRALLTQAMNARIRVCDLDLSALEEPDRERMDGR